MFRLNESVVEWLCKGAAADSSSPARGSPLPLPGGAARLCRPGGGGQSLGAPPQAQLATVRGRGESETGALPPPPPLHPIKAIFDSSQQSWSDQSWSLGKE